MKSSGTVVVGIDFGTTYSGVAWARSENPSNIQTVSSWDSHFYQNSDKEKVPSVISYGPGDSRSWGYGVQPGGQTIKWFKLLLLDDKDIPGHVLNSKYLAEERYRLKKLNKHAVEAISDYISLLWTHSLENIGRALGATLLDLSRIQIVTTIPAIWPAYAKARMREAISMAGLLDIRSAGETTLTFIAEPEAAALATIQDLVGRVDLKKNDHFVVCDAGGGTVDIITYKVMKAKPMAVRESVAGDGKLCGAVLLDDGFLSLLRTKIPREIWASLTPEGIQETLHTEWEQGIKVQFMNTIKQWLVRVNDGTSADQSHLPQVKLDRQAIWNVFKPVLAENEELVMEQVRMVKKKYGVSPKFVILVGGFGKSRLLREHIQDAIQAQNHGTEILQSSGERPWTAVCRGAVMRGLVKNNLNHFNSTVIDGRISRSSIGTVFNEDPYVKGEHDPRDKMWCTVHQRYLAEDQVQWFLNIGDTLLDNEPQERSFYQDLDGADDKIETQLVYCTAPKPPHRFEDPVKFLCKIQWSKVPNFLLLPITRDINGNRVRRVDYRIRMVTESGTLDFQIFYQDKMVAAKNVSIDFTGKLEADGSK